MQLQTLGNNRLKLQKISNNGLALSFPLTPAPINNTLFNLTGGDWTLEFWFYVFAFTNPAPNGMGTFTRSDQRQTLLLTRTPGGYTFWLRLAVQSSTSATVQFFSYQGEQVDDPTLIQAEAWYHLRLGYQESTGQLTIWLNNQKTSTSTLNYPLTNTINFSIGHIDTDRLGNMFNGQMDEFRWWRYLRSDDENVQSWRQRTKYLPGINTSTMACCYDFEDINQAGLPATFADGSGNGLHMRDSTNASLGVQRGSTAPLLSSANTNAAQILTI